MLSTIAPGSGGDHVAFVPSKPWQKRFLRMRIIEQRRTCTHRCSHTRKGRFWTLYEFGHRGFAEPTGEPAFGHCKSIKTMIFPQPLQAFDCILNEIHDRPRAPPFEGCSALTTIKFESMSTATAAVRQSPFGDTTSLNKIELPLADEKNAVRTPPLARWPDLLPRIFYEDGGLLGSGSDDKQKWSCLYNFLKPPMSMVVETHPDYDDGSKAKDMKEQWDFFQELIAEKDSHITWMNRNTMRKTRNFGQMLAEKDSEIALLKRENEQLKRSARPSQPAPEKGRKPASAARKGREHKSFEGDGGDFAVLRTGLRQERKTVKTMS